jgi:thiol-disulfide isomerase/thioredoxin
VRPAREYAGLAATLLAGMTTGVLVLVVVLAAATGVGLVRRRRDGVLRATSAPPRLHDQREVGGVELGTNPGEGALDAVELGTNLGEGALDAVELGTELGERATLVQFSSAFCQPCRVARVVLADVAATVPGVVHVEIDAESRLDLVRRLGVLRTPTVLVLDRRGVEVRRASGAPRKPAVLAAVAELT